MATTGMEREQFIEWLRAELPRLLREDPAFSAELVGILAQSLGSRSEFNRLLEEIKALREDFGRRFEAADRRFEAMDQRFQALERHMERRFEVVDRRFEAIERTLAAHSEALRGAQYPRPMEANGLSSHLITPGQWLRVPDLDQRHWTLSGSHAPSG